LPKQITAGVVGLGKMGLLHAGILNSLNDIKVVAVAEREKIIAKYIRESLPNVHVYEDSDEMFESEHLDLAFITTPVSSHFNITQSCISHDINFFVEKPLCKNSDEAKKLCESLKLHPDLIHSVGFNRRFIDTFSKAKELLDNGILGDISFVKATMYVSNIFSQGTGWRSNKTISGGGVLLDLGSHVVDLLLWYFGRIDRIISSELRSVYSVDLDDFAHVTVRFSSGIECEIDTSWSVQGYRVPELNLEILGSNGKMRVNEDSITFELLKPVSFLTECKKTIYKQSLNKGVPIDLGGPEYTREDIHLVDCIREAKQSPVNVFQAANTQCVIDAIYEAARSIAPRGIEYFG